MGNIAPTKGRPRLKDFVSWFEIPAYDINRAAAFYNTIYQMEMEVNVNGDFAMAFFPADRGIGGAVVVGPGCTPSATGPLIYLNAGQDLDSVLARVEAGGGRVIMARSMISESAGAFALIIDSEGNRIALHEGPRAAATQADARPSAKPAKAAGKSAKPARTARTAKTAKTAKTARTASARKKPGSKSR